MLNSQVKANTTVALKKPVLQTNKAKVLLTFPQGLHLPNNKTHSADQCFSLHPELLTEFCKRKKEQEAAKAHFAMLEHPSMFNVEANNTQSDAVNKLVASFNTLSAELDNHSDGHKSEASLL
ncbi:hypothetical protein PCANC_24367 [Puccinia coronata f. sp. avenae]|nr:hypothetical protein PCANC_24367 [Puccinia coronata f. sp. avenae]PLW41540.1 hypothetical protein PCASD_09973 [Puccinia coronata f. sp. avenae]